MAKHADELHHVLHNTESVGGSAQKRHIKLNSYETSSDTPSMHFNTCIKPLFEHIVLKKVAAHMGVYICTKTACVVFPLNGI